MTQELSSKMTYVVAQLFFTETCARTKSEDLLTLASGMLLSLDGERSGDPAMIYDWAGVVGSRTYFTRLTGFIVTREYLENWYAIGPQPEIRAVIDSMSVDADGEPLDATVRAEWNSSWERVLDNLHARTPFISAHWPGTGLQGRSGSAEWTPANSYEFIED